MRPLPASNALARLALRGLACAALAGVASFVLAFLALHALQPALSPLREAMSYYVHGAYGWLATVGLIGLGLGSLALTIGVARTVHGPGARGRIVCLVVWSICVFLGGVFPADPPGNWDQPPSIAGAIHGYAALVGLFVFPFAAILVSRAMRREVRGRRLGGIAMSLAVAAALSLVTFIASLTPALATSGPPVMLGLTERIMLATYAAWLAVVAIELLAAAYFYGIDGSILQSPYA